MSLIMKPLMLIKKKRICHRIEPYGTPTSKLAQKECCLFKTTFCFLSFEKFVKILKRDRFIFRNKVTLLQNRLRFLSAVKLQLSNFLQNS